MNYTSAAIGVIGVISVLTWFTTGRKNFTGPNIGTIESDGQSDKTMEKESME